MTDTLAALGILFSQLSLVAVGGGNTILPEMQRQVVDVHHWMDARTFSALFALAQASPGPNMLISTLIGWRVAGGWGATVATAGMFGPPAILTFCTARAWDRFRDRRWRRRVQAGLLPLTAGLVMAAAMRLGLASAHGIGTGVIVLATAIALISSRINPLMLLALAALLGAMGVG